ncbi:proline-rich receptor-like protein kinase PERK3 [Arachis duranensis]|uniref:Proline-rich receptor-like protein kinase PERK3 n=1 Tax=Arachis duranensis TaxID=130453 RepID=A0A6P4CUW3_ARADU|nr:proline-rich receptor-like protein kinase PERK3 [Arachis duranensis]
MMFQWKEFMLLFITFILLCSQTYSASSNCVLNIQYSSTLSNSNCEHHSWGGFINTCCQPLFDDYLYALGLHANKTGKIFLNPSEQENCFVPAKNFKLCGGVKKLTRGAGGCSDYTVMDVTKKLGENLRRLDEDCMNDKPNGNCSSCLKSWEDIVVRSEDTKESESESFSDDVCRFAVLITMTSIKVYDRESIQKVYKCIGGNTISEDKQEIQAKGRNDKPGLRILAFALTGVTVVVLLAALAFFVRRKRGATTPTLLEVYEDSASVKITLKDVYVATNNLSAANFIGQGSAGKVYKGILSNGLHVAVKHITNGSYMETFVREVKSLSHVKHPNLVTLLGYCENNESECFLVYELCCNGSLSHWLFDYDKVLSWIQRLEIAVDSARGLKFLQTYPGGCIVHRDIKPANILLDANFQAKLSDFGLSKVMDVDQSYVSSEVRGTFGYIDPEYRTNHHVNASGDVYSFGIVLLQLLSGQRLLHSNFHRPMSLSKMAKDSARGGDISEFADPKLNGEYSVEAFGIILKLALSCIGLKEQRPSITKVLHSLEKALDISSS